VILNLSRIDAESRLGFRFVGEGDLEGSEGDVVEPFSQPYFYFSIIVPRLNIARLAHCTRSLNFTLSSNEPLHQFEQLQGTFGILMDLSTGIGIQNGESCIDMSSVCIDPKREIHFGSLNFTNVEALFPWICFCRSPSSTHANHGMRPNRKIMFCQS